MKRVYIRVIAKCSVEGYVIPQIIVWEDGRRFEISRAESRGLLPTKTGDRELAYDVKIGFRWKRIYLEVRYDHKELKCKWFVEKD